MDNGGVTGKGGFGGQGHQGGFLRERRQVGQKRKGASDNQGGGSRAFKAKKGAEGRGGRWVGPTEGKGGAGEGEKEEGKR